MRKAILFTALAGAILATQIAAAPVSSYFGTYGSKHGRTYHTHSDCKVGARIKSENVVYFTSSFDAEQKHRTLCASCRKLDKPH